MAALHTDARLARRRLPGGRRDRLAGPRWDATGGPDCRAARL